jgi:hypothetical protein
VGNPLKLNQAGSMSKGINENQPDFQMDLQLTDNTVNVTSGIVEGIGPRYGFAPIPGHMDQEVPTPVGETPGIMRAEISFKQTSVSGTWQRTNIYGIFPFSLRGDSVNNPVDEVDTYYAIVLGYTTSVESGTFLDVLLISTATSQILSRSSNIFNGIAYAGSSIYNAGINSGGLAVSMLQNGNQATLLNLTNIGPVNFLSSTSFSVSGTAVPMNWMAGNPGGTGTATTIPPIILNGFLSFSNGSGTFDCAEGGPPSFVYGNFSRLNRTVYAYGLNSSNNLISYYQATFSPTTSNYLPLQLDNSDVVSINLSGVTASLISGSAFTGAGNILYNDNCLTCNSAYQGVLVATGSGAVCTIFQDWFRGRQGDNTQYVDLSNIPLLPPNINEASTTYTQDGASIPISFNFWPPFTTGTPMGSADGVSLGAANSGLLRAKTIYEFTYSIFDKRLNYESNVGAPVRFQTGSDDLVCLNLFQSTSSDNSPSSYYVTGDGQPILPWPGVLFGFSSPPPSTNNFFHLNYLEYRFYYRQLGMLEYSPALFVDAAQYWFYPFWKPLAACVGGIGALPAGRPGGFNDYSTLPEDNWNCVVMYKNRAFWFSPTSFSFSLQNNILSYPQANSGACPTGAFKGALVQAYYGQANQDARIVVFSTNGTYVGKFTGNLQQVPIQISPSTVANFGLDGSDFVLNAWTSVTAFSYRSAVVAEGLLYFWGPNGIFLDDGVNPIQRISVPLEPAIFNVYDPSQTDAIHCEYNDTTKEIWWFYYPLGGDATYPTHGICYNKLKNTWLLGGFEGAIDAVQSMHVENEEATAGARLVVFSRQSPSSTIQRAYYFDQNNLASDIFPGKELMVKAIATPVGQPNQRTLTLAAGYSTGAIVAGDLIALQQCAAYGTSLTSPSDFIAKVIAYTAGSVTIALPNGATLDGTASISTNSQYFPIWHAAGTNGVITGRGINAFDYNIDTKFWIPNGMSYWALWNYLHLVYKLYDLLPIDVPLTQTLNYQTPVSGSVGMDTLTLINNSANNCQIFHPLAPGDLSFEGQGIKLTFSGIQLAGSWVIQFLEAMSNIKDGMNLFIFEG